MSLLRILIREVWYRKLNSALSVVTVLLGVGAVVGALSVSKGHEMRTQSLLEKQKEAVKTGNWELWNEMRKATLKLTFNLLILPKEQDLKEWHLKDYASTYMPEEYVEKLADSGIVIVRHFLPVLQQKVEWPETKRTIILVGTRGEVPNLQKNPRKPLVQPVPEGTIVLGYALSRSLGLKEGDKTQLMGKQFRVHKCHEQRGSKDDITAWISLHEAQELLGKKGLINAIMALECLCTGHVEPQRVREEITKRLPGTQVVELGTRKLSREEARLDLKAESLDRMRREKEKSKHLQEKWENFSAVFLPLATVACIVLIGLLGWANVTDRETEIGILRAIGLRSSQLMKVFLLKALLIGLVGGAAGIALGYLAGSLYIGGSGEHDITFAELFSFPVLGFGIVVSVFISVVGGWIPALYASQRDPASILRDE